MISGTSAPGSTMKGERTIAGLSTIFNQTLRYLLFDNKALKEPPKSIRETEVSVSDAGGTLSEGHEPDSYNDGTSPIGRQRKADGSDVKVVPQTQDGGSEVEK
jgi:hypothetical protein